MQTEPAAVKLQIVMTVYDHTRGDGVTVVASGLQAEKLLGLGRGSWSLEAGLAPDTPTRLAELEGGVAELGVELLGQSSVLLVLNTVMK